MKNPLAYTYIEVRTGKPYRQLEVVNDSTPAEGDDACESAPVVAGSPSLYFGPYTSRSTVEKALHGIKESFKLLCSNPRAGNTSLSGHTPCLNHSLGLCLGMCTGAEAAMQQYNDIIDQVVDLLNGSDTTSILAGMEQRMNEAAEKYDYEKAARLRDAIGAVRFLIRHEQVVEFAEANRNIAVLEPVNAHTVKLLLIKGNQVLHDLSIAAGSADIEVMLRTITQAITDTFLITDTFKPGPPQPTGNISRHDIDEAQIIYSFLQGSSRNYMIVPEEWLTSVKSAELNAAVEALLNRYRSALKE